MAGHRGSSHHGKNIDFAVCPPRILQRSVSEHSPISPLQPGYASTLSQGGPRFGKRPTKSSAGSLSSIEEQQHTCAAYSPSAAAPRSTPSLQTSFPAHRARDSPVWSHYTQVGDYLQSRHASFSPVSTNRYDFQERQSSSRRSRAITSSYMGSPTTYSCHSPLNALANDAETERGCFGSSVPNAIQRPVAKGGPEITPLRVLTTSVQSSGRQRTDAVDEFTSPSDFALFVEATSSLSINSISPNTWSSPRVYPEATPPPRLLAPLPPLSYHQLRSRSSPATSDRQVARQPSHSQLVAEALVGLVHEDMVRAEAGTHGLNEDELTPDDDEDGLPDYAQSQAEASARQRREAARRAQELDEAWSRARRRRG
ncbi:hypothetical protein FKW77_000437 [Venturia effusa]|uniref:Uncharacterized protein n=1 Tax=Venturia effusa TaxID=50376 RepID=A0A517LD31_9PEZI|nr:hypothetical protein FKW77_000437 [Venturia effusa]